jgi:ribosomal-protein-serine acetyltransferase
MIIPIDNNFTLRLLQKSDGADIYHTIDNEREHLGPFLPFVEKTKAVSDTQAFVDMTLDTPEEQREYTFTIRESDQFIGLIGFKSTDRINMITEIGYWLSEKYQGGGIMTRAVEKLIAFAFEDCGMNRIVIKCAVGNTKSKNIPKRLGFTFEGTERDGELLAGGVYTDIEVYSLLKRDRL